MAIRAVNIIGSGNVGTFFALRLQHKNIKILSVYSRDISHAEQLALQVGAVSIDEPANLDGNADLNIICLKDDVIGSIAAKLNKKIPAVHTSGSQGIEVLKEMELCGIIYPLQTISKERIDALIGVPFLIEANNKFFASELGRFCENVFESQSIYADSSTRADIHLAAVMANNFSNFFLTQAKEILDKAGVDFEIMKPLMMETIAKAFEVGPLKAQTGPAKRRDLNVTSSQLEKISDRELKEVYRLISKMISERFNSL